MSHKILRCQPHDLRRVFRMKIRCIIVKSFLLQAFPYLGQ